MWPFRKSPRARRALYHPFVPDGCTWWPNWFFRDRLCECNYHDALWFRIDHDSPDWREKVRDSNEAFQARLAARYEGHPWQYSAAIMGFGVSRFGRWFKRRRSVAECRELFGERWEETDYAVLRELSREELWDLVTRFYC